MLAVGLSNAGARVVVVDARAVTVFDADAGRRLSSAEITPAPPAPTAATISPDGHTIAVASRAGSVSFIDTATGHAHSELALNDGPVTDLAYSPDGRAVASAANNTLTIWNPRSATPRQVLTIPGGQVQGIAFSPHGHTLYTSSVGGLVLEWDLTGQATRPSSCAHSAVPVLRPALTASAATGPLARRQDVRRPPRRLHRWAVLRPDLAATGIFHRQAEGRQHHRARVVTHCTGACRWRARWSSPVVACRWHAPAGAGAERPAVGPCAAARPGVGRRAAGAALHTSARSDSSDRVLS